MADGELFTGLGRRTELQLLLDRAQNDQIHITIMRGESGVGKTSLLQAGLQFALKRENCVYCEARASDTPAGLLHAIQSQFPEIESLDSLPQASQSRWVLILDQFEQLSVKNPEHSPVFRLLQKLAKAPPPYRLSAVVCFRREYQANWSDFELANDFRAEQVVVSLMPRSVASDVIAFLAGRVGFTLEQELVENFVASVAQPESDRISPLDISIGIESLANFAEQKGSDRITMSDYRLAGGAEGLLLTFVQQRLEEIPQPIRESLLKGIVLSLIDLPKSQRAAAGATVETIATAAEVPAEAVKPWLHRLTHPRVRLLERVGSDHYRLPHERLIPVLRRLAGIALARLDQVNLLLDAEFARWQQTRNSRHLLMGRDLVEVLKYRDQLLTDTNPGGKSDYLQACLKRRTVLRWAWTAAGVVVVVVAYGIFKRVDTLIQRAGLRSWGMPTELLDLQYQLDLLSVGPAINDFDWLRSARLRDLRVEFTGSSLAGLKQLKGLAKLQLNLGSSSVKNLAELGHLDRLTSLTLDLSGSAISDLAGLQQMKSLSTLQLNQHYRLKAGRILGD